MCILSWAFNDTKHYLFSLHVLFSLNLFVPFGHSFAASESSLRRGSAIHEQNKWYFYRGISVDWGIWLELTWWILIRCFRFNPAEVRLLNSRQRRDQNTKPHKANTFPTLPIFCLDTFVVETETLVCVFCVRVWVWHTHMHTWKELCYSDGCNVQI